MVREKISKKQTKILMTGIVFLMFAVGLIVMLIKQFNRVLESVDFPTGKITHTATMCPIYQEQDVLQRRIVCPSIPYSILVTESTENKNECLKVRYNNINILVMETEQELLELMKDELPKEINFPLIGYEPEYKQVLFNSGYIYEYPASYCAATVTTKISVRDVKTYTVAYSLDLSENKSLVLYASVEDKKLLEEAEQLLSCMVVSLIKEETVENEADIQNAVQDDMGEDLSNEIKQENEKLCPIDLEWEVTDDLEDGVCLIQWTNIPAKPEELYIYGPNGEIGVLDEEYSRMGHYVYNLNDCSAGMYCIVGTTYESLENCTIDFIEKDGYLDLFVNNDENIVPHGDE